ncbi:hypothetical protein JHW43_009246 [Diplocarpon mali]|nr:hypothetical protein JHW43_009246 [Diplocarpon mali]
MHMPSYLELFFSGKRRNWPARLTLLRNAHHYITAPPYPIAGGRAGGSGSGLRSAVAFKHVRGDDRGAPLTAYIPCGGGLRSASLVRLFTRLRKGSLGGEGGASLKGGGGSRRACMLTPTLVLPDHTSPEARVREPESPAHRAGEKKTRLHWARAASTVSPAAARCLHGPGAGRAMPRREVSMERSARARWRRGMRRTRAVRGQQRPSPPTSLSPGVADVGWVLTAPHKYRTSSSQGQRIASDSRMPLDQIGRRRHARGGEKGVQASATLETTRRRQEKREIQRRETWSQRARERAGSVTLGRPTGAESTGEGAGGVERCRRGRVHPPSPERREGLEARPRSRDGRRGEDLEHSSACLSLSLRLRLCLFLFLSQRLQ